MSLNDESPNRLDPSTGEQAMELEIGLRDVFYIIRERWLIGTVVGLLVAVATGVLLMRQTPMYKGVATLQIELTVDQIIQVESVNDPSLPEGRGMDVALNMHYRQLTSRGFLERVVESLSPEEIALLIEPSIEEGQEEPPSPLGVINKHLEIERDAGSPFFEIIYEHEVPSIAALIPNRISGEYIFYIREKSSLSNVEAGSILGQEAESSRRNVERHERLLMEYREKNQLVDLEESQSNANERVRTLNGEITEAEIRFDEINVILEDIGRAEEDIERLVEIPHIGRFGSSHMGSVPELVAKLEQLAGDREILEEKYLERHPKIRDNQAEQEATTRILRRTIDLAVADLRNQHRELDRNLDRLKGKMQEAELEKLELSRKISKSNILKRDLEEARKHYELTIKRQNEVQSISRIDNTNIRVLDSALEPSTPSWPNPLIVGAVCFALFGFVAPGLPLAIGLLDNRLRSIADIEVFLRRECMGSVTHIKNLERSELATAVYSEVDENLTESFRGIFSHLQLSSKVEPPKSIVVTSTLASEGKSFVVANLGALFARHGYKTIIVDCDLRRPAQHRNFGLDNEAGVLRWIEAGAKLDDEDSLLGNADLGIAGGPVDDFYLLRAGGSTKHPSELLGDLRFERLMKCLRRRFDIILVDAPPVGLFPDALFLAENCDEAIYVCRHNYINRYKVSAPLKRLDMTDCRMLGVVYNMANTKGTKYSYAYGSYSYKEYRRYYDKDRE